MGSTVPGMTEIGTDWRVVERPERNCEPCPREQSLGRVMILRSRRKRLSQNHYRSRRAGRSPVDRCSASGR
jgi:hypothetical protein